LLSSEPVPAPIPSHTSQAEHNGNLEGGSDPYADATIASLRLKPVTTVLAHDRCDAVIETMRDKGFDQVPVLANAGGRLIGLVTLGNLLSYISHGRAVGASHVKDVMFDFEKLSVPVSAAEVERFPERFGEVGKKQRQRFIEITMETKLSSLSRFFEHNSAAVVTEQKDSALKPVAVVTKVDLLGWLVKRVKTS
jgi:cystathionine beta-synthase